MSLSNVLSNAVDAVIKNPRILLPAIIFYLFIGASIYVLLIGPLVLSIAQIKAMPPGGGGTAALSQALQMLAAGFNLPGLGLFFVVAILLAPFLYGFYNSIGNQAYNGGKVSMSDAFKKTKHKYLSLLTAYFLIEIIAIFIIVLLAALLVLAIMLLSNTGTTNFIVGTLLSIIIFILVAIGIAICFYETFAVIIIEDIGAFEGVSRSIQIGRKYYVSIFLLLLIIVAASAVLSELIRGIYTGIVLSSSTSLLSFLLIMLADGILFTWVSLLPSMFYNEYVATKKKAATKRKR